MTRAMITDAQVYFRDGCGRCDRFATPACSAHIWADALADLRDLCRAAGLDEVAKWGHPAYMYAGRNVAILGAFQRDVRLTFFHPALMTDPARALQRQGPNTRHPDMLRFCSLDEVTEKSALIAAYLAEAKDYAKDGILPDLPPRQVDIPPELIEALDCDPELATAFAALTPGRQKSWAFHLRTTQNPATRIARIAKARGKILSGKGALER